MNKNQAISKNDKSFGIYHDLVINAPVEMVFDRISNPKHLINWWPLKCEGNPEKGGEYNFYFSPKYNWFGTVCEFIPNRSFYVKMTKSDLNWDATTFGFDLNEESGDTQLCFSHVGWPKCNSHFRISSFCWAMLLKGLKDYVEKGIILPFEERS